MNIHDLYRQSRRAALFGVAVTLSLGLAKLAGGVFGHSLALLSDSVHSLGDTLAAASVWGALLWAQQPADREHPYGHTRVEAVAGSNVALLLILSGLWVAWEALHGFGEQVPPPETFTLVIAFASILLSEWLYQYSSRVARQTGSSAVLAASWDQRLDAFGSLAVLVGLALAKWGGPDWHAADHVAALLVALVILWTGGNLFWASVQELMDRQADPDLLQTLRQEAQAVAGVRGAGPQDRSGVSRGHPRLSGPGNQRPPGPCHQPCRQGSLAGPDCHGQGRAGPYRAGALDPIF